MLKVMFDNLVNFITYLIIAIESNTIGLLSIEFAPKVAKLVEIMVLGIILGVIVKVGTEVYYKYIDYVNQ